MSLINEMLRDLDQRRAAGGADAAGVQVVRRESPAPRLLLAVLLTLATSALLAAGVWWLWLRSVSPAPQSALQEERAVPARPSDRAARGTGPAPEEQGPAQPAPGLALAAERPAPPPDDPVAGPDTSPSAAQPAPAATPQAAQPAGEAEEPAEARAARPDPEPAAEPAPRETPPEAVVVKRPAAPSADMLYREGREHAAAGRWSAAADRFAAALDKAPELHAARLALVDALLRTGRAAGARRVLEEGMRLAPAQHAFVKQYAGLLLAGGDPQAALAALEEAAAPAPAEDPEWHSLKANLLQRLGRHAEAGTLYGTLLRLDPGRGVWWAGLAISLDQQGRGEEALAAYRRAQAAGGLAPSLAAYVNERVAALQ